VTPENKGGKTSEELTALFKAMNKLNEATQAQSRNDKPDV